MGSSAVITETEAAFKTHSSVFSNDLAGFTLAQVSLPQGFNSWSSEFEHFQEIRTTMLPPCAVYTQKCTGPSTHFRPKRVIDRM